jgi:hypothetical protein
MSSNTKQLIRLALIFIIFAMLLFGVFGVVNWINHREKAVIVVDTAPSNSHVTINGKTGKVGKNYVSPGTYIVEVSHQYFTSTKKSVTATKGNPQEAIILPKVTSSEATQYYADHPDEVDARVRLGGEAFSTESDALSENYENALAVLPIISSNFGVYRAQPEHSKLTDQTVLALQVAANNSTDRARAIDRIRSDLGIDPSLVEIDFKGYINPFDPNGGYTGD